MSLLPIAGMILARFLLNRLIERLEQSGLLTESQGGFKKDRGTIKMIFTARQLQEKCQEYNVDFYMTFVDLTKAFDTISVEKFWKILAKFGCPAKLIENVRQFYDGMLPRSKMMASFFFCFFLFFYPFSVTSRKTPPWWSEKKTIQGHLKASREDFNIPTES